ncbi:MAG TPA: DNA-formamidopyrimidine glycosylase family protein [Candidatus Limnocylindrales bacterium]|nr:DNA-formamidopyrimidine glycosylase family protein [Candidatus Limnocylindrales bacterium]
MPEGDTLQRTAAALREILEGRELVAARGRRPDAGVERLTGRRVAAVHSVGKHLLIDVAGGLTLHTHLGLHGSWHRYRHGERWRRPASRAAVVLETAAALAVCFDPATVELVETRALPLHPRLASLGPDLLDPAADPQAIQRRLREVSRGGMPVGEALLDQRLMAGLGNVYRSEVCFIERVDPATPVKALDDVTLGRLVRTAMALLRANTAGGARVTTPDASGAPPGAALRARGGGRLWVYGRTGRPCRRCGTLVRSRVAGTTPRRAYWCPTCQPPPAQPTTAQRPPAS